MDLSVVVVSWNTRELLRDCLWSVYDTVSGLQFEVVVVDNGSSDGSAEMVANEFPQAVLLRNEANRGFAAANNQAILKSSGHYVLLLNPDTEARPGALATLVSFLDEHPEAGAAGSLLLDPGGGTQLSCSPMPTLSRELWRLLHLDQLWPYASYPMRTWPRQTPREVDVAQGACLILRREALAQAGYLDEDYFIYTEEVDLCHRVRGRGWKVYWVPTAEVVHYGGRSTRQVAGPMFLWLYRSKVLFFRKRRGRLAAWVYKAVLLLAAIPRLAASPLARLERPPRCYEHAALARGYWELVKALPTL